MDKSLHALCDAIRKISTPLQPRENRLSFLLIVSQSRQGKTTLMKQSGLRHYTVHGERKATIFYHEHGIILELGETWLPDSDTLRQINRCQTGLHITGLVFCMDIQEFLLADRTLLGEHLKNHAMLFTRLARDLKYPVASNLVLTKADMLAGFIEFFQENHATDLAKPLGFSLAPPALPAKTFSKPLEQFAELLGQQVIPKMHPARSGAKRTLIREFPLQIASLRTPLQILLHHLGPLRTSLQAIYFTSAQQGGTSINRLNPKIREDYALTVQDSLVQAHNHRAFFVEGLIQALMEQSRPHRTRKAVKYRWVPGLVAGIGAVTIGGLLAHHLKTADLLDAASKELLRYEALAVQGQEAPSALYHLARASETVGLVPAKAPWLPTVTRLKSELSDITRNHLTQKFLPGLVARMEQTLRDSKQPNGVRHETLKMYLMLGDETRFSRTEILAFFRQNPEFMSSPQERPVYDSLLNQAFMLPMQPLKIDQELVGDIRNFLNALPPGYLYYSLAKQHFPKEASPLAAEGFDLANPSLPVIYTRAGFEQVSARLPDIAQAIERDAWVLDRKDSQKLTDILLQAYSFEYVSWWQEFALKSRPSRITSYAGARHLAETLDHHQSFMRLANLIRENTAAQPEAVSDAFHENIAKRLTDLNLTGTESLRNLTDTLRDLTQYLSTLAIVDDQGKTAFSLARTRFDGDTPNDPLSHLYRHAQQVPAPAGTWARQIADDIWSMMLTDTRNWLNHEWKTTVWNEYTQFIANRYPLDAAQDEEIAISDFDRFFSTHGILNRYADKYMRPFLDTSKPEWEPREVDGYRMPITPVNLEALIRANIIGTMFYNQFDDEAHVEFSLQKMALDPVISKLQLQIGKQTIQDNQESASMVRFTWPTTTARLTLDSIDGNHYELAEQGPWAFFRILQKVNILADEKDSTSLHILFEVNGNSGRYVLKTSNPVNPFTPGILNGFMLEEKIA